MKATDSSGTVRCGSSPWGPTMWCLIGRIRRILGILSLSGSSKERLGKVGRLGGWDVVRLNLQTFQPSNLPTFSTSPNLPTSQPSALAFRGDHRPPSHHPRPSRLNNQLQRLGPGSRNAHADE